MKYQVEELEAVAGPVETWEGSCYGVACKAAELWVGEAVYGHWLGPVNPTGYWSEYEDAPFIHHGWLLLPDGTIVDPTRWSFEAVEPYIWVGENDGSYDRGGNQLRATLRSPPPAPNGPEVQLAITSECEDLLHALLGDDFGPLTAHQLMWLANAPLGDLSPHTEEFFGALVASGLGAFIPMDNRQQVLGQ